MSEQYPREVVDPALVDFIAASDMDERVFEGRLRMIDKPPDLAGTVGSDASGLDQEFYENL